MRQRTHTASSLAGAPRWPAVQDMLCEACGLAFARRGELQRHARGHVAPVLGVEPEPVPAGRKP